LSRGSGPLRNPGQDVYVGLDLGTSGLKAAAVTPRGETLARASVPYPTARPEPGASEQDPDDWLIATRTAIATLSRQAPPSTWRGIGLSGMIPTLVNVDRHGRSVGPAITWEDSRAENPAAALRAAAGDRALYEETGQWVDARYLMPMHLRRCRTDPEIVGATVRLAGAKDYLLAWLTGEWVTDPSTATGYGCFQLEKTAWAPQVIAAADELAGRPVPPLPEIAIATGSRAGERAGPAARATGRRGGG
jgi:xylulokinase